MLMDFILNLDENFVIFIPSQTIYFLARIQNGPTGDVSCFQLLV